MVIEIVALVGTLLLVALGAVLFSGKAKRKASASKGTGQHGDASPAEDSHMSDVDSSFMFIPDQYSSFSDLQAGLKRAGLGSCNLVLGIDYTLSNNYNGEKTFFGRSLHDMNVRDPMSQQPILNPYQQVIKSIWESLNSFDDDGLIPAYGFGDSKTEDHGVFSLFPNEEPANGVEEVLRRYNEVTPTLTFKGPTNFAPLIRKAIDIVKNTRKYHILLIIADGEVVNEEDTTNAIIEAANHPLSIVTIGVGDGPFDAMYRFDDALPERRFDNFQFVNYNEVVAKAKYKNPQVEFARQALQEIPDQFRAIKRFGLL